MRWFRAAVALAALGVFVAEVASAGTGVPSFTRQTGLACNQCHMTWTPTPDLTFTGIKFRLNGYRTPFVAEKVEAGEEGALNGRRLVLGLQNYWTLHYRSNLLQQSKPASDPTVAEPDANPVSTNPFNSVGLDYAGPIGEHFGIWTEYYFAANNGNENVYNLVSNDEYDVKYVFNPGGNIVAMFMSTQSLGAPLFAAFGSGVANNQQRSGAGGNGHAPYANVGAYGMWNDRVITMFAVQPGEDNLDYRRLNYEGILGFMPWNSDAKYLLLTANFKAGNDMVPQVSSLSLNQQNNQIVTREAIRGVSATRTGSFAGQPYASINTGDATRWMFDVRYGWLDKGPHSFTSAWGASVEDETYDDGAKVKLRAVGATLRYMYDRTYGINFGLNKRLTYEFTDAGSAVHKIPTDLGYNVLFIYRAAMNFAWEFGVSNSQSLVLDQNWRNGWNWNLQWHFLY
ncbi:MAG TPA: hypothetical protein VEK78_02965 [Gemmatimonadales bacterium]|nr:hypothetical protein [Gemmatimonadales bacterium]